MKDRGRIVLAALLVLAAAAGGAWWRGRPPRTPADARAMLGRRHPAPRDLNLVVVTLDTLRADRLGCYGFQGAATPRIDALARQGVLFEQAAATASLTFPSHSSIFTGLIPPHHGVRDNGGFFLDDAKTTLAERLRAAGWTTGAFVGAWVLEAKWGLAQGFDRYSDEFDLSRFKVLSLGTVQKRGDEVMDDALAWLETVRSAKFFAWVHLYDPHAPYDAPEPFRSRHTGEPYLGEIAYTDQVVGRLLAWLDSRGLAGRTLVVLTADHGESLGEHGEATHGYFIYDATVRVPLIIRTPWGDRGRVRGQVGSVDILPTVLDLLGLPPQEKIDGRSLARALLDPRAVPAHAAYSETYFPRYHFGWHHLRGLRTGAQAFIDAPRRELYDLAADPGETRNIYESESRRGEELRAALEALAGEVASAAPERQRLDPETLQRLGALGYVGNVGTLGPEAVLPDPKDKVGLFGRMNAAKAAAAEGRLDEAVAGMRAVVSEDTRIADAHLTLGNWLAKAGRKDEAEAAFRQVLGLTPDDEIAMVNLAHLYRSRGQAAKAIEGYRTALELDARSPQTWYQLATLFLDLGRVGDAETTFRQALESNPQMGAAYNSLGVIAFSRGRLEEAEGLVAKALELEPRLGSARFNLARIREARGDFVSAERLYREELETYPDHGRARFNLAQILGQRSGREAYLGELRACVAKSPEFGACHFYLARAVLEDGRLEEAASLAEKGLASDGSSQVAPLGHYVLADVYHRRGQRARADAEVARARSLEAALRRNPPPRI